MRIHSRASKLVLNAMPRVNRAVTTRPMISGARRPKASDSGPWANNDRPNVRLVRVKALLACSVLTPYCVEISGSRGWMAYRLPKTTSEEMNKARLARRKAGVPRSIRAGALASEGIDLFVLFEGAQGKGGDAGILDQPRAAQVGQVDDRSGFVDFSAEAGHQPGRRQEGAAGGDQVIQQQHLVTLGQRVAVDLQVRLAVLGAVALTQAVSGQLAGLAEQDQRLVELIGQYRTQQEAPGINGANVGHRRLHITLDHA